MKYLGETGVKHLIEKMKREIRDLQDLILPEEDPLPSDPIQPVESWSEVKSIVQSGLAPSTFALGDLFQCEHQKFGTLTWQIVGFDQESIAMGTGTEHSMTLQLVDPLPSMPFNSPHVLHENLYTVSPGTYTTQLPSGYFPSNNVSFVLDREIPPNSKFILRVPDDENLSEVKMYIHTSNDEIFHYPVTWENSGIALEMMAFDERAYWGWNFWIDCDIDQYLNSYESAGNVWNQLQYPFGWPLWKNTEDGFIRGLESSFCDVLANVKQPFYDQDLGAVDSNQSRMFYLPTLTQVYGASTDDYHPCPAYSYYTTDTIPGDSEQENRKKTRDGQPCAWWLRTPVSGKNTHLYVVDTDGSIVEKPASNDSVGIAPMCCIA